MHVRVRTCSLQPLPNGPPPYRVNLQLRVRTCTALFEPTSVAAGRPKTPFCKEAILYRRPRPSVRPSALELLLAQNKTSKSSVPRGARHVGHRVRLSDRPAWATFILAINQDVIAIGGGGGNAQSPRFCKEFGSDRSASR